jgi:hypothetical protein
LGRRQIYIEMDQQSEILQKAEENLSPQNFLIFKEYTKGLHAKESSSFLHSGFYVRAILIGVCLLLVSMPFRHSPYFEDAVVFGPFFISDVIILPLTLVITLFTNYLQTEYHTKITNLYQEKYYELS